MTNNSIHAADQMPPGAENLVREDGWKLEVADFEEPVIGELMQSHEGPQVISNKDLTVVPFPEPESSTPRVGEGCMEVVISSEECLTSSPPEKNLYLTETEIKEVYPPKLQIELERIYGHYLFPDLECNIHAVHNVPPYWGFFDLEGAVVSLRVWEIDGRAWYSKSTRRLDRRLEPDELKEDDALDCDSGFTEAGQRPYELAMWWYLNGLRGYSHLWNVVMGIDRPRPGRRYNHFVTIDGAKTLDLDRT